MFNSPRGSEDELDDKSAAKTVGGISSSQSYWGLSAEAAKDARLRRICVIGARGVGKSSVTMRCCENTFEDDYVPTIEDSFQTSMKVDGKTYFLEIIDTEGQDRESILGTHTTIGVHGYIIVYSVRDQDSLQLVKVINDKLIVALGSSTFVPRIVVGNQTDIESEREVSVESGKKVAKEIGCAFIECSAKNGTRVKDAFALLIRVMEAQANPTGGAASKGIAQDNNQKKNPDFCIIG